MQTLNNLKPCAYHLRSVGNIPACQHPASSDSVAQVPGTFSLKTGLISRFAVPLAVKFMESALYAGTACGSTVPFVSEHINEIIAKKYQPQIDELYLCCRSRLASDCMLGVLPIPITHSLIHSLKIPYLCREKNMEETIVNRVAKSGIVTIDLEEYFPKEQIVEFDIKDWLFHGLILKEQDFRTRLQEHDWAAYQDKHVTIYCSTEAIIPFWAYMLLATELQPFAKSITQGNRKTFLQQYYRDLIQTLHPEEYKGKRIVVKGCSDKDVPASAYAEITARLLPYVKSIMYGEPCSTVPVYKAGQG